MLVVGQNPGQQEEQEGRPFVGATGQMMERVYFPLAGLVRGVNVSVANAIRCRWHHGNDLPALGAKDKLIETAIAHCANAHLRIPPSTKLIVAQGAYSLYALTGQTKINDWRGYLLSTTATQDVYTPSVNNNDVPVLATVHLAALFRHRQMELPTRADWVKVGQYLRGEWPQPLPTIQRTLPQHLPHTIAFDTEFTYPGPPQLLRINIATPDRSVYVVESEHVRPIWLTRDTTVVAHNWVADWAFAQRIFKPWSRVCFHDTMLMHSVLWPGYGRERETDSYRGYGMGQGLDFLGSIYASINRWKHLAESNPIVYAAGDAIATLDLYNALKQQYETDPASWREYTESVRPLIPIIYKAEQRGIRINTTRVQTAIEERTQQAEEATLKAQAYVGYPINLASTAQVGHELYVCQTMPKTRKSAASCDADTLKQLKQAGHESAVLDSRLQYIDAAHALNQCLLPLAGNVRAFPTYLPTQASGRWSMTGLYRVNFPPDLRDVIIPDPGTVWIKFDLDAIEAKIVAALSEDWEDLEAFQHGYDIHTLTACRMYHVELPPILTKACHTAPECEAWRQAWKPAWEGADDLRRRLAKVLRYGLFYGYDETSVLEAKGVEDLHLTREDLLEAGRAYLKSKPALRAWKMRTWRRIMQTREARTFLGRRRRFFVSSQDINMWIKRKRPPEPAREGLNHEVQGAVGGMMNRMIIAICQAWPEACLVTQEHDGAIISVPKCTTVWPQIRQHVEQTWNITERVSIVSTAEWKLCASDGRWVPLH